jgi:proline iminopeptidase
MLPLYPEIEPYATQYIRMEAMSNQQSHEVYVEECGNPDGIPVVFLHGGPGSGCRPLHRRYFDPNIYRIVLFDQRGCGRSKPLGELAHNTSHYLIADMNTIRTTLDINEWVVFGGSWGATLGLLYAQAYPRNVLSLILRGTFLGRKSDVDWVYAEGGASKLFPEAWHALTVDLPNSEKSQPLQYFHQQLSSNNSEIQLEAAQTLGAWESTIVTLRDHHYIPDHSAEPGPIAHSRIQLHFALNDCFISATPILDNIDIIRHIPTFIVHGRYDVVCPAQQSWQLKEAWPEADLTILPIAGHAAGEPAVVDALVKITQRLPQYL